MTTDEAVRAYRRHLTELLNDERNVREHAGAIAFRRLLCDVMEAEWVDEIEAAGVLRQLGVPDPRPPLEQSLAKMRIATRHLVGKYGNPW